MSRKLGWSRVPIMVLAVVAATWLLLEGTGLLRLETVLDELSGTDRLTATVVIFLLLVVDVLLPVPSTPLMVLAGTILGGPAGIALSAAACIVSSACAYALGRFARPGVLRGGVDRRDVEQMRRWGERFGLGVFALARAVPMLAETAGISAGISRVPFRRFIGATFLGTVPLCVLYGTAGSQVETVEQVAMLSAVGFLVAAGALWALRRRLGA